MKTIKIAGNFYRNFSNKRKKKLINKLGNSYKNFSFDALNYCLLAEGKVDVVIQCGNKIWDIHPLIPIIESAGGTVSNWKNESAVKAGNILVSANKKIHKKFLKILKMKILECLINPELDQY